MACSNCNTPNCGCSGTYVVSQTCPPACSEVFNSSCIVYTGVDLTCTDPVSGLTSTIISRNDYLDTALTALVNYICARFNPATLPSSVVVSGDSFVVVDAVTVGYVTTYTVTLDPAGLPSASIVTEGDNVTVTGDGSAGDPYVINANESIVAVDPASALTLLVDPSTPGPYETTYTIGVDASLLPVTELQTSFGHIFITEVPNTPNAGDTTYTLEVDEVTVQTDDDKLAVTLLSAGGIAPYERTFNVAVDDTEMSNFIMDTAGANIVGNGGIVVTYDAIAHEITISETIGLPNIWFTIGNGGVDPDISAASNTDTFNITADAVTDGLSVGLAAGPGANEATFTLVNEDRGSAQDIFKTIDCANGGVDFGTITAALNNDNFGLNGGAEISLSILGNDITIDCDITSVFSNIAGDAGNEAASTVTDTLEIIGATGSGISTSIAGVPGTATMEIDWAGVTVGAGLTGSGTAADPLVNASPATDVALASAGGTSLVSDGVGPALEILGLTAGTGIGLGASATAITINADVQRFNQTIATTSGVGAGGAITITHNFATEIVHVSLRDEAGLGYFVHGTDYSITHVNGNEITITDLSGALSALVGATPLRALITG